VDPDGVQLGIKTLPEALAIAKELDLDLVEVAPMANPPVCRIMDFGKFKFDEAQRAKESRRKTVHVGIKEMKYRPKIGPGDFDTKTRQVGKFLNEGHKVKITIMFRGREVYHPEHGKRILDRIAEQMEGIAKIEAEPKLDNRNMIMVLAPDKRARQAAQSRANQGSGSNSHSGSGSHKGDKASGATPEAAAPQVEGVDVDVDEAATATNGSEPVPAEAPVVAAETDDKAEKAETAETADVVSAEAAPTEEG
jgi:translation initiation factor IF-3